MDIVNKAIKIRQNNVRVSKYETNICLNLNKRFNWASKYFSRTQWLFADFSEV